MHYAKNLKTTVIPGTDVHYEFCFSTINYFPPWDYPLKNFALKSVRI